MYELREELVIFLVSHLRARKLRMSFMKVKSVTLKNVVIAIVRYICVDIYAVSRAYAIDSSNTSINPTAQPETRHCFCYLNLIHVNINQLSFMAQSALQNSQNSMGIVRKRIFRLKSGHKWTNAHMAIIYYNQFFVT